MYYWTDKVEYKEVEVFGEKILVTKDAKYVAVDKNGDVHEFNGYPRFVFGWGHWDNNGHRFAYIGQIAMQEHIEDWTVLIEYVGD